MCVYVGEKKIYKEIKKDLGNFQTLFYIKV